MIVKYYSGCSWKFIDNINHAESNSNLFPNDLLGIYDIELKKSGKEEAVIDNVLMSKGEAIALTVFNIINRQLQSEYSNDIKCLHAISAQGACENKPIKTIIMHTDKFTAAIITNQDAFLMNDKGQTIERLS